MPSSSITAILNLNMDNSKFNLVFNTVHDRKPHGWKLQNGNKNYSSRQHFVKNQ